MSRPDLLRELRESRPVAPAELRERIRLIAAEAAETRPPRSFFPRPKQRRALLVLVPIALAATLAAVVIPRGGEREDLGSLNEAYRAAPSSDQLSTLSPTPAEQGVASEAPALAPTAPPTSSDRAQRYSATLTLRLPTANGVSKATNRALHVVASLGGYPQTVRVDAAREDASAYLIVKVPRTRVHEAVRRLGALGTIVGEDVSIQDLQAGVDTTSRTILRLQRKLNALREQPQTADLESQIASLTKQLERLRLKRAATLRAAQYATVELRLATPPEAAPEEQDDGPLHGLVVAFRWIGIGAVYALALGTPLVLLIALGWFLGRGWRRRREERLLSRA
jgi:uncharacterized protein DUF4349